jgi:hypothetical protein
LFNIYICKIIPKSRQCFRKNQYFLWKISLILAYKFNDFRWDREGISIPCIKGIYQRFFISKLSSIIKKKLFGKQAFDYLLDYNKMFLFESGEGYEPKGQIVGYLDDIFIIFYPIYI